MATHTFSSLNHVLLVGGSLIPGWKSVQITIPNERFANSHNADGSNTFEENSGYKAFEGTITVASTHAGNSVLSAIYTSGASVPIVLATTNSTKVFSAINAKVILTSFGVDDGGADTPTEWKVIGDYDICLPTGNLTVLENIEIPNLGGLI